MRTRLLVGLAAVCLVVGCSTEVERRDVDPVGPATDRALSEGVVDAGPALLPDAAAVVADAGAPHRWFRGRDRLLLTYLVRRDDREGAGRSALVLLSSGGTRLGRWAATRPEWGRMYWVPAGNGFVALDRYEDPRFLLRSRGVTNLATERGSRDHRDGDVRFGEGWLLDPARATVVRERLPRDRCGGDVQVDPRRRTWCLDERRRVVSWTDDHRTWASHRLSTSHFEYCDGGALGAELDLLGDQVVVGLYRADISPDRGRSWYDVELPYAMVGAHRGPGGSFPNCVSIEQLRDGRLVLSYFDVAVATDPGNALFATARSGLPYRSLDVLEGILASFVRSSGERLVSYDGGTTWVPFRVPELLDALFDEQGG